MKLIREDLSSYKGVRWCRRCGCSNFVWLMTKYEQLEGFYCTFCSYQIEQEWNKHEN